MNGIKMKDCKFYVDENARTVVCVIPHTSDMLLNFIDDHFRWDDMDFWTATNGKFYSKDLRMPNSFMGKAVCAAEDEWNEETGRLIAFSRAKDKCYRSFFKRANRFVQTTDAHLNDMITLFNDFGLKLESKRENLQEKINGRVVE